MMHIPLRKKEFWGLIFPPLAGLGVLIFIFFSLLLPSFEASLVAQKKQTIRELTRSASHILEYYENKRQKGELSRDEAQHKAMEEIRALRYGPENRDYFWINDLRPVMLMHPYRPDLEGKNVAGLKDSHGVLLIMEFIEATRETGSGYVPYYWQWKDDPSRIVPKLSYVQRFPPWQWIIGTGIYLEDVRKEIALITQQLTVLFVLIFAVVVLGSGYAVRQGLREAKRKRLAEESSALYLRELQENEERYQELFDHMGDGVAVYQGVDEGQDFVFVDMNKTGETVVQMQREEVVGRRVTQVFPAVERMGLLDVLRRVWRTGQPEHHPFTEYADGRITLWAENYIYKLPSGLIVAIYSDTTEKRRADEALRESEEKYRTLVENIPQKIFTKDKRLIYLSCNENFARDQGVTPEELTGKTDYDFFPKELADKYRFDDMRIMASGKTEGIEEQYVLNGEKVWVYTVKTPIRDSEGNTVGILGVFSDITERKRAEEEKANLESQLQQAQKMESVGRLAGGVAHDFNNMLGVILGHAEMALLRVDPAQPIHADLMEILKAGKRSADLTRQLLAFARRQTVTPEVLDLNETVAGMLKMLQRLIGEDIHLHWQPETNLWPVRVDPSQIDQILANLCVNARDAIAGIGRLSIEIKNSIVDEEYCAGHSGFAPGEYVRLTVNDDGCGMDQEMLAHIFEPFFTTKGVGEGTGLGLATVYGIVKQNNGFINVYSEPGKGTAFTVYLPRHAGKVEQARRPEGTAEPALRGHETILLVEDESAILEMTTMMLEMQGYTVLAASTPGEAIRLAGEYAGKIHLLITDVVMPEMNGRDLAKNLLSLYPHLKCLFMSGYMADVIAHHGVLDEGVSFIQKPFSRQDLAAKVRKVLEGA